MSIHLIASPSNCPLGAIIVAEVVQADGKISIRISWSESKGPNGVQLLDKDGTILAESSNDVSRYLARVTDPSLYGGNEALERTEVDHWLSFAIGPLRYSKSVEEALAYLERSLTPKTWLVAKQLTIADLLVFSEIHSKSLLNRKENYPNITRWYHQIASIPAVMKAIAEVEKNAKPAVKNDNSRKTEQSSESINTPKQEGKFIDLPGAEMGKLVVRFPPEASGYLHIGHAKAALLNQYYADAFQGKLIMRFDDTNPAKESVEFEEAILEDLKMLQIKPHLFTHTSQYFDLMLTYCEKMINEGKAYVDDTPAAVMKEQRDQRLPSANRDNSVEKNLHLWKEMKDGTARGTECCVRAKIDYASDNGCMRDPTIYRCKPEPHPRTGTTYKVYPTYDFACPIVDAIEGVTHTLRTTEYHDRDDQFYWLIEALGLRRPYIWEYSRLNMTHTVLSKRRLTWFVEQGLVDGWDDPRFPTVRGILRRGMTVYGLKQFIIAQGSSKSVVFMEWDKIWAINKKVIDPIATRYTALVDDQTVLVRVEGATDGWLTVQNHPKNASLGTKKVRIGPEVLIEQEDVPMLVEGKNATFINWGNLLIEKIKKANGKVTEIQAKLNLGNKDYKTTPKLTWLCREKSNDDLIPCYAVYFEHIINKAVLGKDEDFKNFVAKDTRVHDQMESLCGHYCSEKLREVKMVGEVELKRVVKGEIIQLQRKGFFRCDVAYAAASAHSFREQPLVLFHVPDGHTTTPTTVATKSTSPTTTTNQQLPTQSPGKSAGPDVSELNEKVALQGEKVRQLKAAKADKQTIDQEVKILLSLKTEYKNKAGTDWKPSPAVAVAPKQEDHSIDRINNEIIKQGDKVRELKTGKAEKSLIETEVKTLLKLKAEYKSVAGKDWKPGAVSTPVATKPASSDSSVDIDVISSNIAKQGDKVRELKSAKAEKSVIDQEVKILLDLKTKYKGVAGKDWKPSTTPAPAANKSEMEDNAAVKINDQIVKQGDKVRELKTAKAEKNVIDQEVKILLNLKTDYKTATGKDWKPTNAPATATSAKKTSKDTKTRKDTKTGKDTKTAPKDGKTSAKAAGSANAEQHGVATDKESAKTGTRLGLEAKKSESLSDWYSQVITKGELIEYYDVSGCYILRPWSYSIWEVLKDWFDGEIKKLGIQNCYFPMFVSKSALETEKKHIADFAPEVAWVTKSGESDLAEPIAIRPTSETVMYPAYAKWLKSHRDLPLKLNQWNNVVRWEFKHPQPFLRTREFLWQEGHTAFATKAEAEEEVLTILDLYAKIYEEFIAVPVVKGRKTEKEKFAGGDYTTTIEAFVAASGRAIQGATSHFLGQNFSKMFDIQVEGAEEGSEKVYVYQNSWGFTTRTIGVMIMVHGDDRGLVLPPKVACIQAVIVPCGITASSTPEQRSQLLAECTRLENELRQSEQIRVKGDYRDNYSPGWKFNHWELKGVPLRIELGPKDLQKEQVTLVRRDNAERITIPRARALTEIVKILDDIQNRLFARALEQMKQHTIQTETWNDFCAQLDKKNLLLSPFCGEISCEERIKADSTRAETGMEVGASAMGAKSLCIPFEQPKPPAPLETLRCIHPECKNIPKFYTLFGRSY